MASSGSTSVMPKTSTSTMRKTGRSDGLPDARVVVIDVMRSHYHQAGRGIAWYHQLAVVPLRIGIFAPYDLARAGGITTQVRSQTRALRRLGHDVRVYGPASGPLPEGEVALGRS